MGSGIFPLAKVEPLATKIINFISDTEKDIQDIIDSAASVEDGQFDNSF